MSLLQRRRGHYQRRPLWLRDGPRLSKRQRLSFRKDHLRKLPLLKDLLARPGRSEVIHAARALRHRRQRKFRRRKLLLGVSRRLCARHRNGLQPRLQNRSEEEVMTGTKISPEELK